MHIAKIYQKKTFELHVSQNAVEKYMSADKVDILINSIHY